MIDRWWACGLGGLGILAVASGAIAQEKVAPPAPEKAAASVSEKGAAPAQGKEAAPTAAEFAQKAFIEDPRLAPDGHAYAARAFVKGKVKLLVITPKPGAPADIRVFSMPAERELIGYRWAGPNRLLVSLGFNEIWDEEERHFTRIMIVDLTTSKTTAMTMREMGFDGDNVIYVDPKGDYALLNVQPTPYDYPGVYKFNLSNGNFEEVVRPVENVWDWYADADGVVRVGVAVDDDKFWVLYRDGARDRFQRTSKRDRDQFRENIEWFAPIPGKSEGYALALTANGRYGLRRYDFVKDELGEVVWEHPQVDVDDVDFGPDGAPVAIYYTDDRDRVAWLDPELKRWQAGFDKAVPGAVNQVVSLAKDRSRALVRSGSAHEVPVFFLYDKAAKRLDITAAPYMAMMNKQLAAVESISYRARDGLEIPGYLTLPRGRDPKGLPLIVMPHGGPFARDKWDYDYWVQFLAARGYAVLQPNYRGSTGYGQKFVEAGTGAWGRGMQDDIDDGVKWLIDKGVADAKRVCIMGGSFGGYAAMWAAARNPDIYRCAISFAGVSDVRAQLAYQASGFSAPRYFRNWRQRVAGAAKFDFSTISPLQNAQKISIPLLLVHGTADTRVPFSQSRKLHDALEKLGKPHEWVVYKGESHFLEDEGNATDFLKRVAAFLDKHNPA